MSCSFTEKLGREEGIGDKIIKSKVVDKFKHKGILCVVVKIDRSSIPKLTVIKKKHKIKMSDVFHNGYVKVSRQLDYQDIVKHIDSVELTYSGGLDYVDKSLKGMWFIGFDTAHYWNEENPKTQTAKAVKEETIKLCEELIRKNELKPLYPLIIAEKL